MQQKSQTSAPTLTASFNAVVFVAPPGSEQVAQAEAQSRIPVVFDKGHVWLWAELEARLARERSALAWVDEVATGAIEREVDTSDAFVAASQTRGPPSSELATIENGERAGMSTTTPAFVVPEDWVHRSRAKQGLPATIEDEKTLSRIATLIGGET